MEGRRDDMEIRDLESPLCGKELFAHREDRLLRLGETLSARIPLVLRPVQVLVQALLV
jgi:hypothetical protein